jgi:hypothetical protein
MTLSDNMEQQVLDDESPLTRYAKLKNSIRRIPISLARRFRNDDEQTISQEHNPLVVYHHPIPNKIENLIQRSNSLASFTQKLQRLNPRHRAPEMPQNRIWDSGRESLQSRYNHEEDESFPEGSDEIKQDEGPVFKIEEDLLDSLFVLTSKDMKYLEGRCIDKFDIVRPAYRIPPPTPRIVEAEAALPDPSNSQQMILLGEEHPAAVPSQQQNHKHRVQKDGLPHSDFHIVGGKNTTGSLYEHADNLSDYYGMPLIEDPASLIRDSIKITPWSHVDDETITLASNVSSNYDQEENNFCKAKDQVPAQAMLLFLRGQGKSFKCIAKLMSGLDDTFLYKNQSRWWNGERISDLPDFDNQMVVKVLAIAKAPRKDWEGEFDMVGKRYSENYRILKRRMRERKVEGLCTRSLENYFWWRCRGEVVHTTIPR